MGVKNFLTKQLLKKKLKDVPKDQADHIMGLMENHPELFEKIAVETKQLMKEGKTEMQASMLVMKKYQNELRKAMS